MLVWYILPYTTVHYNKNEWDHQKSNLILLLPNQRCETETEQNWLRSGIWCRSCWEQFDLLVEVYHLKHESHVVVDWCWQAIDLF